MSDTAFGITYRIHRRTLIRFVLFLLALLVVADVVVIMQGHTTALEMNRRQLSDKLSLAGDFCVEAILKDDYVSVEQFLLSWAEDHNEVLRLKATTPNDFAIVDFQRDHDSVHTLAVTHQAKFQNQTLLVLDLIEDQSALYSAQWLSALWLIGLSVIIVAVFGVLLWATLRRTAFLPLQNEISQRQKTQQELIERSNELEVSNQELEAFCYSVSHDLRAPLRAIHGFSAVLQEDLKGKLDETEENCLQRICNGANKMSLLIDVLLDMSRVARRDMAVQEVNLSDIATDILSDLQQHEPQRKVRLTVEPDLVVKGDPTLLRVVLSNLLDNAWKYGSQEPEIAISFEAATVNRSGFKTNHYLWFLATVLPGIVQQIAQDNT